MKKSVANIVRLAIDFEQKLHSSAQSSALHQDNPYYDWLKLVQQAITKLVTSDKDGLGLQINAAVSSAQYSGTRAPEQGSPWTSTDEDGYYGQRTKAALGVVQRHLRTADATTDQGKDLLIKINQHLEQHTPTV